MRMALLARAAAVLQLLRAASALVVEGEGVDQPRGEGEGVVRLSLEEREKLEAEDWERLTRGAAPAAAAAQHEEDWERLEAEDWARVEAEHRSRDAAARAAGPPPSAAAAAAQPAPRRQGLLRWIRMRLRRGEQPASAAEAPAPASGATLEAAGPAAHSSEAPAADSEEATPNGGEDPNEEAREAARQAAVDSFLDSLEQPSDAVLDNLERAFSTTSAADSFLQPRAEAATTAEAPAPEAAKPLAPEAATPPEAVAATPLEAEAKPTRPPPVFCPTPDQVREQEAREAGQKRGGRDVGIETKLPGCSPEERLQTAAQLERTFAEQWRSKVADIFSLEESGTYLSIGDWRAGPLLGNWLSHAGRAVDVEGGIHLVNVALDKGGMTGCRNLQRAMEAGSAVRLTCVSLAGWLPDKYFDGDTHMGSCDYNMILWTKPIILKAAVEASDHAVLMTDTDVILYKDLLRLGKKKLDFNHDKKMITGREKNGQANTGTVYATRFHSMPFLEAWVAANNQCLNGQMGDQSAMQHVIQFVPGMRLALETFQRGEVGECAIKGKFATHYNCVGNKHKAMKDNEEWAEGVSPKPEEIAGPNPVIALRQRAGDSE